MIQKLFITSALFLLISTNILSQTTIAKYAGEFMAIGVGGRPLGLGGAYTALANDVTAGYYNPAGLAHLNYPQISLMHDERFGNLINYDYAAVALPWGKDLSFGISLMRLGIDGIPDTRNALYDANGDGKLDINDDRLNYSAIKYFSNQDWAAYLTFAKRHSDNFFWGANIKLIKRSLGDDFDATGIGFDVGAWYSPVENLSLGVNLQDITTTLVAWNTGKNDLVSPTAKIGAAYNYIFSFGSLTPVMDFDIRFENRRFASNFNVGPVSFDMHAGLEFMFKEIIAIRGGYNDIKQFTVGAGIKLPKLNIDYSFAQFTTPDIERLGDTHRFSIILTLEETRFLRKGN
jgi:hypothetical protein